MVGRSLSTAFQLIVKHIARLRVERGEWFIHEEDSSAARPANAQSHTLLHAAGKL